jgi:hypothetical protein
LDLLKVPNSPHKKVQKKTAKRRVKLGGNRGATPSAKMQKASAAALLARADARAADIAPVITELRAAGATSLRAIADGLNAKRIPTARGTGEWTATQVMRVLEYIAGPFEASAAA